MSAAPRRPPQLVVKTLAVTFVTVFVLLVIVFVVVTVSVSDQVRCLTAGTSSGSARRYGKPAEPQTCSGEAVCPPPVATSSAVPPAGTATCERGRDVTRVGQDVRLAVTVALPVKLRGGRGLRRIQGRLFAHAPQ